MLRLFKLHEISVSIQVRQDADTGLGSILDPAKEISIW